MGFYIQMLPQGPDHSEYLEEGTPPVFWVLFLIAGFALLCMGMAAYHLLFNLIKDGSTFDYLVVGLIFCFVPFYFLIGIKFTFIKKFISFNKDYVRFGFNFSNKSLFSKKITRSSIKEMDLINRKPTDNLAPQFHENNQYYIRGHWRVGVKLKTGKFITLDRHTEKEALLPLYEKLQLWFNGDVGEPC